MKQALCAVALGVVLGIGGFGRASADSCVASAGDGYAQLSASAVANLLGTSMACYPAAGPPWTNQEYHTGAVGANSGNVIDYKKGPTDPRDPSKQIGSYTIVGTGNGGQITYNYTNGPSYSYSVWGTQTSGSGTYDFCNGTTPLTGRVKIIAQTGAAQSCGP